MITAAQTFALVKLAELLAARGAVLSDFEAALVVEVGERFIAFRDQTVITAAEWAVLDDARAAMQAAAQPRAAA